MVDQYTAKDVGKVLEQLKKKYKDSSTSGLEFQIIHPSQNLMCGAQNKTDGNLSDPGVTPLVCGSTYGIYAGFFDGPQNLVVGTLYRTSSGAAGEPETIDCDGTSIARVNFSVPSEVSSSVYTISYATANDGTGREAAVTLNVLPEPKVHMDKPTYTQPAPLDDSTHLAFKPNFDGQGNNLLTIGNKIGGFGASAKLCFEFDTTSGSKPDHGSQVTFETGNRSKQLSDSGIMFYTQLHEINDNYNKCFQVNCAQQALSDQHMSPVVLWNHKQERFTPNNLWVQCLKVDPKTPGYLKPNPTKK